MFTITTATGKQFESDFAVDSSTTGLAFVRILNQDKKTIENLFKDPAELPFDCFPEHNVLEGIFDEGADTKLMLKKGVTL